MDSVKEGMPSVAQEVSGEQQVSVKSGTLRSPLITMLVSLAVSAKAASSFSVLSQH